MSKPSEINTNRNTEYDPSASTELSETPFEIIHDDLEMYRSIVDAFKLLSKRHKQRSKNPVNREIEQEANKKHMKRLSLIACGFDQTLADKALAENDDLDKAFEYARKLQVQQASAVHV
uniref:Uncharacterized protein n=1 Tax=Elphidium margaritaceum TaxID=933848 RepID=A0A6T9Z6E8_9EUKA|mmetsp:Transcript_144/g.211  ORF Transcript_144/g.211 Transcript_144/m.211 type:complete len:119 (+) Transcript_144:38-394(+)|eukprot:CAMPEP_0202696550 /NCGR_PEP_ID=MMETSP1385-20130828/9847_1 /ASSEMBLY_ACC=CAM_ASM_000861 /TAXON_ID=933848 /ORGANISM="Elphidium margaritaceum" /LENGTH=118 /DNA_ID=CAMNT_0049352747 /DNA_START=27 /DNA_END=383 /DNA_ORIENTATION=-